MQKINWLDVGIGGIIMFFLLAGTTAIMLPLLQSPERLLRGDCIEIQADFNAGLVGVVRSIDDLTGVMVELHEPRWSFAFYTDRRDIKRVPLDRCYKIGKHNE